MSLNNLHTLTCQECGKNLLKVYIREGLASTECKIRAKCPCGGYTFVKNVKGACNIAPEPNLDIVKHEIEDIEFILDDEGNKIPDQSKIGVTTFLLKENNVGS